MQIENWGNEDFLGGLVVKNPPGNAGDTGSIPSWGTRTPHAPPQLQPMQPEPVHNNGSLHMPLKSRACPTETQHAASKAWPSQVSEHTLKKETEAQGHGHRAVHSRTARCPGVLRAVPILKIHMKRTRLKNINLCNIHWKTNILHKCWRGNIMAWYWRLNKRWQNIKKHNFCYYWNINFLKKVHLGDCLVYSSVAQYCLTLCDPMNHSMPGLSVHHQLPEFTQTHVHWVGDAIQPSHPLSSPSPPGPNPSQHQGLFQWVNSLHQVAKIYSRAQ